MLSLNESFRPSADVVDTELGDAEVALLDLETKTYFSLNNTGACIWEGLKSGLTLQEISHRLQQEFDVSASHAEHSVVVLVEQLISQKLVEKA